MSADDDDPYAGEDPPEDYLEQEAAHFAQWHRDDVHGGRACDCPTVPPVFAEEAPF